MTRIPRGCAWVAMSSGEIPGKPHSIPKHMPPKWSSETIGYFVVNTKSLSRYLRFDGKNKVENSPDEILLSFVKLAATSRVLKNSRETLFGSTYPINAIIQ